MHRGYMQRLPDVILRMSFTRPFTALGDRRPGNEAKTMVLVIMMHDIYLLILLQTAHAHLLLSASLP